MPLATFPEYALHTGNSVTLPLSTAAAKLLHLRGYQSCPAMQLVSACCAHQCRSPPPPLSLLQQSLPAAAAAAAAADSPRRHIRSPHRHVRSLRQRSRLTLELAGALRLPPRIVLCVLEARLVGGALRPALVTLRLFDGRCHRWRVRRDVKRPVARQHRVDGHALAHVLRPVPLPMHRSRS